MLVAPVKDVTKPWGGELWVAVTEHYALKIITLNAGKRSSLQYHERKHEHIYIDRGRVKAEFVGPEGERVTRICGPGTIIENAPGLLVQRSQSLAHGFVHEARTGDIKALGLESVASGPDSDGILDVVILFFLWIVCRPDRRVI